ncbi:MAG: ATP-dependent helicase, partial [Bdellovibrio sp.]|nr:ATP-dependent helicase [Bdellovibrio sp.]
GLRLSPGKTDCLILDYTGQGHDIYSPEIDEDKPSEKAVPVEVICHQCGVTNSFWGLVDEEGTLLEHYGRKCQGAFEDPHTHEIEKCKFRFRFKKCDQCGEENDIAARACASCSQVLVDNDKKLKEAMLLKDAHVMRVESMSFHKTQDKKGTPRLEVHYYDADAQVLKEYFYLDTPESCRAFYFNFIRMHSRLPERKIMVQNLDQALALHSQMRLPMFVIARKQKHYWSVREKIFE